ncbi:MAG: DNA recombination protein RmuC [Candidatus Meridianibacter frigidus]|nr:MAG: DNA recombination protein RmuC [Candidatus Eremiobacteraeota bacterium]
MTALSPLWLALAFALGALVMWLAARAQAARLGERAAVSERLRAQHEELQSRYLESEQKRSAAEARLSESGETHREQIAAIAQQLKNELHEGNARMTQMQSDRFLELANARFSAAEERANAKLSELVTPVAQKLTEFDTLVREIERQRHGADQTLKEQIAGLLSRTDKLDAAANQLTSQTSVLVGALRNPTTRGKWGEVQLRRVVELAGMEAYCDFSEQQTLMASDQAGRPDMTVTLPGNSMIFVDAKVPLAAYLDAIEAPEEPAKKERLRAHAQAMKNHVDALAKKNYHHADGSAEFVVMFVPGEAFLSAACTENPGLIEHGASRGVYIASPLTLMALLRSYALGWQQRRQEENAKKIAEIGRELYDRVRIFAAHFTDVGSALGRALKAYNNAAGSFETRVLPQGRRLKEVASLADAEIPETPTIEIAPRELTALDAAPKSERGPRQGRMRFPAEGA